MQREPKECSFCGAAKSAVAQLFENEEGTAAICSACVAMFAQNLADETVP